MHGKTNRVVVTTESAETIFPAVPESVGAARRFTRAALGRHAIDPEIIDTAMLLVSELATNAILHGTSTIRLRVGVGEDIRVEVRDGSDEEPVVGTPDVDRESGRGLAIVTTLAESWNWSPRPPGKVVWFELPRA